MLVVLLFCGLRSVVEQHYHHGRAGEAENRRVKLPAPVAGHSVWRSGQVARGTGFGRGRPEQVHDRENLCGTHRGPLTGDAAVFGYCCFSGKFGRRQCAETGRREHRAGSILETVVRTPVDASEFYGSPATKLE